MAAGYAELLQDPARRPAADRHAGRPAAERHRARSPWCCSPAPRAAATPWPGRSPPCTAWPTPSGSRCWAGRWTCYGQPRVHAPGGRGVRARDGCCSPLVGLGSAAGWPTPRWLVAGLFTPPLEGGLRALWPGVLQRRGPGARGVRAGRGGPGGDVRGRARCWSRCWSPPGRRRRRCWSSTRSGCSARSRWWSREPSRRVALRAARGALAGRAALAGAAGAARRRSSSSGLALGSIAVAACRVRRRARRRHRCPAGCWPRWALGALVGGVGLRRAAVGRARPSAGCGCWSPLLALGYLPLVLMPGVVAMTALAGARRGVPGARRWPAPSSWSTGTRRAGTVTEAFSWLVTTFGVGAAVGTAVAGPAVERGGAAAGFAVRGSRRGGGAAGPAGRRGGSSAVPCDDRPMVDRDGK